MTHTLAHTYDRIASTATTTTDAKPVMAQPIHEQELSIEQPAVRHHRRPGFGQDDADRSTRGGGVGPGGEGGPGNLLRRGRNGRAEHRHPQSGLLPQINFVWGYAV